MHRIISAFRLLMPRESRPGPLRPASDGKVSAEAVGDFLNAIYVAVEKMRAFGLADEDFAGPLLIVQRAEGEKANGRYFPKEDVATLFHPQIRGAADWPWTIIHEVMHRVWVKHLSDEAKELWGQVCTATGKPFDKEAAEALSKVVQRNPDKSSLWFYFTKHFGDDPEKFKLWLQTRRVSDSLPSKYASTEPAEAFSEVAANTILGRGHAGREINRTGSMLRKVFLSIMEPLRKYRQRSFIEDLSFEHAMAQDENFLQTQVDFGYLRAMLPKWVRKNLSESEIIKLEHRPHTTVYYGADRRDLHRIEEIVKAHGRPIRMSLGALNVFEHPEQDVLYIEMVGDPLVELHNKIAALPHTRPPTHPKYLPHLTIAYLKKGAGRKFIGNTPLRMVVTARGMTLIDASGIEQTIRFVPDESLEREPLLMAGK